RCARYGTLAGVDFVILRQRKTFCDDLVEFLSNCGVGIRHGIEGRIGFRNVEVSWTPIPVHVQTDIAIQHRLEDMIIDFQGLPPLAVVQSQKNILSLRPSQVLRRSTRLWPARQWIPVFEELL